MANILVVVMDFALESAFVVAYYSRSPVRVNGLAAWTGVFQETVSRLVRDVLLAVARCQMIVFRHCGRLKM